MRHYVYIKTNVIELLSIEMCELFYCSGTVGKYWQPFWKLYTIWTSYLRGTLSVYFVKNIYYLLPPPWTYFTIILSRHIRLALFSTFFEHSFKRWKSANDKSNLFSTHVLLCSYLIGTDWMRRALIIDQKW